ncbi:hypothetical protein PRK78_001244 [Emydomyces testavorans]|uniref:DNA mismatch repair protein MutS core domain-containing protein n=1 Tax=Emydomyces testavorans TaxID=2070801 RepID=A0AAF0IGP2_9EURO|nr:hypothetical protein PRK78_001244 [Emydomyces testavorans]
MTPPLARKAGRLLASRKPAQATLWDRGASDLRSYWHHASPTPLQSRNSSVNQSTSATPHRAMPEIESNETDSIPEENRDDDLCQVVMAIDIRERGTVGCAYYVAEQMKLYILEDITSGGTDVVETLKLDVEPTVVILSTRADRDIQIPNRKDNDEMLPANDIQFQLPYHLDVRPSQEFSFEAAKTKLMGLNLGKGIDDTPRFLVPGNAFSNGHVVHGEDVGFTEQQGKFLHLASIIDMENCVSIGCAGALVTYLQRKRSTHYLQREAAGDQPLKINAAEMLSLEGSMFINRDTLASLQIIQTESHPNAFNQGPGKTSSGSKESLSIYGLFHRFARTPQGKGMLKKLFLRPTIKPDIIRERHDFISTFLRPENCDTMERLIKSLKGMKNVRPVMVHLQKGISTGNAKFKGFKSVVWATLLEFSFHAIDIHENLKDVVGLEKLDLCLKTLHKLELAKLHQIGRAIHETVDLESSVREHRTVVQPRVDQELDKLKETYNGMDSLLSQIAAIIAGTLPEGLSNELNVIYFPQLGFNIAIPLDEHGMPVYDGGDEAWTQVFKTENRAYFKDFRMHEMDERLGDMYGKICGMSIVGLKGDPDEPFKF